MRTLVASIKEHGDHVYITSPVDLYEPEQTEIETFAFAENIRSLAPNPTILWLRGQYVEADAANRNADQWTAGELAIKALTPVLMPITVMHDLRSAVGTIADAKLLTPEADNVPRARIDSTLAVWQHRFPETAEECRVNANQGTLMQSMECLSPFYDCSLCGKMMRRGPRWRSEWKEHLANHDSTVIAEGRAAARILRNVTFTGVGLIFGTRGARGAMPTAHLEVEELAAMHREAHASTTKRPRRKNTVELEDSKYEGMVAAKAEADSKVSELTAKVAELERTIETTEAAKVKAEQERDAEKQRADAAEEATRVSAMKEERLAALGSGFIAALDKREITAKRVREQAAKLSDEEWSARLDELEESLEVKRDAKLDPNDANGNNGNGNGQQEQVAGLFSREQIANSGVGAGGGESGGEVTAAANGQEPSPAMRQSVIGGLVRPKKAAAKA